MADDEEQREEERHEPEPEPAPVAQVIDEGHHDGLDEMRHEEVRSLADVAAMHAQLLREQREHTGDLTSISAGIRDALSDVREAIRELKEEITSARERHEEEKPLVHAPADNSWGERGW